MMIKGIGKTDANAIYNTYSPTGYIPRTTNTELDDEIHTRHGVTQDNGTLANIHSFCVSDMGRIFENETTQEFILSSTTC